VKRDAVDVGKPSLRLVRRAMIAVTILRRAVNEGDVTGAMRLKMVMMTGTRSLPSPTLVQKFLANDDASTRGGKARRTYHPRAREGRARQQLPNTATTTMTTNLHEDALGEMTTWFLSYPLSQT
jgi:hypothetical protein